MFHGKIFLKHIKYTRRTLLVLENLNIYTHLTRNMYLKSQSIKKYLFVYFKYMSLLISIQLVIMLIDIGFCTFSFAMMTH